MQLVFLRCYCNVSNLIIYGQTDVLLNCFGFISYAKWTPGNPCRYLLTYVVYTALSVLLQRVAMDRHVLLEKSQVSYSLKYFRIFGLHR